MAMFTYEYSDNRPQLRIDTTPPASAVIDEEGTLYLAAIGTVPELIDDDDLRRTVEELGSLYCPEWCVPDITPEEFATHCRDVAEYFVHERQEVMCLGCADLIDVSDVVGIDGKDVMCRSCAQSREQ